MATRFAGQGDRITDSGTQKWINIFGDVQVIRNLERLKTSGQRKIMRKAIAAGIKPIAAQAKKNAPEKTGLLKKSIKSKVTKMVSGKVYIDPAVIAVKGSATGGKWSKVIYKDGKGKKLTQSQKIEQARKQGGEDAQLLRPAKYAHLLEFGTRKAAAKPFMRPALQQGRSSALAAIEQGAKEGLQEALK